MIVGLICILFIVFLSHKSNAFVRINVGLGLFVVSLLVVPVMDVTYIKGQVGVYGGFYVSVAAVALSGIADALVQGGVIGAAGEMPERYMQAVVAGTAASGVLISMLRIFTKAVYSQDEAGLRKSANLYFIVSIVVMIICIVLHNVAHRLPVIKHYNNLKIQAVNDEKEEKGCSFGCPVAVYIMGRCWDGQMVHRLLDYCFFPVYLACLHGPMFLRTEIPVTIVTCLLGLTNGYLTSCLMMVAPKTVPLQHSETAGIVLCCSWLWVWRLVRLLVGFGSFDCCCKLCIWIAKCRYCFFLILGSNVFDIIALIHVLSFILVTSIILDLCMGLQSMRLCYYFHYIYFAARYKFYKIWMFYMKQTCYLPNISSLFTVVDNVLDCNILTISEYAFIHLLQPNTHSVQAVAPSQTHLS
ncbi:putative equilibrative nucleoside transporter [Helianthus annuus]|nr:putative equilibrative nucleoside transporter [Helianthus annuus]